MFKNDLFKLENLQITDDKGDATAVISLNALHKIFEGHFPGSPVLPGVCMVQIIKEILGEIFESKLMLYKINTIKYQNPVNPFESNTLTLKFSIRREESFISVSVQVSDESMNFCSLKGEFRKEDNQY